MYAIHAYICQTPERALAEAHAAEARIMAGRSRGPLDGIPIAHKDIYCNEGPVHDGPLEDPAGSRPGRGCRKARVSPGGHGMLLAMRADGASFRPAVGGVFSTQPYSSLVPAGWRVRLMRRQPRPSWLDTKLYSVTATRAGQRAVHSRRGIWRVSLADPIIMTPAATNTEGSANSESSAALAAGAPSDATSR
jgi:hypothetical protein